MTEAIREPSPVNPTPSTPQADITPKTQPTQSTVATNTATQAETEGNENNSTRSSFGDLRTNISWNEQTIIDAISSGDHFQDNLSNQVNNLTYHWKLFMLPDDRDYLYRDDEKIDKYLDFTEHLDSFEQVVIAETGVTGYNISNVEMDSIYIDPNTKSSTLTNITMDIKEPNGISFMDALVEAAREAKVNNYLDYYYFLELTFKGYDPTTGQEVLEPFPELQNGGRWIWTVVITNLEVNMGSGGGEYKLNMIPRSEKASQDTEYSNALDSVKIRASTIGEYFERLGDALNQSWEDRLGSSDIVTNEFEFHGLDGNIPVQYTAERENPNGRPVEGTEVQNEDETNETGVVTKELSAEAVANMKLTEAKEDFVIDKNRGIQGEIEEPVPEDDDEIADANINNGGGDEENRSTPIIMVAQGASIPSLVNSVFSSCEQAQYLAKDSYSNEYGPDDDGPEINDKGFRESVIWHAIPEIRHTGVYDQLSNRYGRNIIWHIYPRVDHNVILSRKQIEVAERPAVQRSILSAIAARNLLPKKYQYLFTGQNTEVMNFDLNFNLAWVVRLPSFESYYNQQPLTQAKFNSDYEEAQWGRDFQTLQQKRELRDNLREELAQTDINDEPLFNAVRGLVIQANEEFLRARDRVRAARNQIENQEPVFPPAEQNYDRRFIETIRNNNDQRFEDTRSFLRFRPPISQAADDSAKNDLGQGAQTQYHAGKSLYGAVLNQVDGNIVGEFQQVNLTVKGDPFWIGQGSFEQQINHIEKFRSNIRNDVARVENGRNCFVFEYKYPTGVDELGNITLSSNENVTGVFQVTSVKTTFNGGQFQHVLQANKISLLNYTTALAQNLESENDQ